MANEYIDRKWMRESARTTRGTESAQSRPSPEQAVCSFCGAAKNDVKAMFSSQSANICGECVAKFQEMAQTGKATSHEDI